ncbi:hypothetical protein C2L64_45980 [Paraburkholderia hospita]|uniref:Uncharacterized protein n=1 Tax=Paraburkholderia hospita TaxID=169430 RepID=A0AAN1JLV5_9BURK|nr:hypothetical protein C2L64_45980 [Paraburkholderia hospita]
MTVAGAAGCLFATRLSHSVSIGAGQLSRRYETFARSAAVTGTSVPAELVPAEIANGGGAITLLEFCDRYKLSRSTFYEMRKRGLGPGELHIGRCVLIAWRAIREWEVTMVRPLERRAAFG